MPEFVRELKNSLADHTLEEKLNMVKSTPILMLDDIGAESMTSWVRDELLGTILQYRMAEQLPTFFSSNFSPNELKHHFTYSQRGKKRRGQSRSFNGTDSLFSRACLARRRKPPSFIKAYVT
ncbi:hypothetical protein BsIDN1_50680 [Bacillus safensis]|uniref:Uncharacterized protein n=1 Tax=Bacillus safensis TaxID=561879 RepID=A0A5S9MD80_BACIA|nr:hypothetical protein BsIDN1_50680 [Bacillus safensis]